MRYRTQKAVREDYELNLIDGLTFIIEMKKVLEYQNDLKTKLKKKRIYELLEMRKKENMETKNKTPKTIADLELELKENKSVSRLAKQYQQSLDDIKQAEEELKGRKRRHKYWLESLVRDGELLNN